MWGMFYHRLNPKATADAQCPLIVDRRMVILVQIVPNAAVSLVWALPVDLLHQLGDALILGDAAPGCPGAPLVIAGPGDMQCTAGWPHRKSLVFRTVAHRFILLFLPKLPQRSPPFQLLHFFSQIQFHFQQFILLLQPGVLDPQGLIPAPGRLVRQALATPVLQSRGTQLLILFHPAPQRLYGYGCACATSWSARPPSRQASTASSRSSMVWSFLMIVPPLSLLEFLS